MLDCGPMNLIGIDILPLNIFLFNKIDSKAMIISILADTKGIL